MYAPPAVARSMHNADHRQPGSRQTREVVETFAAEDEVLDAILEQVRAGRFDQMHERQLVLQRDVLRTLEFFQPERLQRAGVDAGVVGKHETACASDVSDQRDRTAARNRRVRTAWFAVVVVLAPARKCRELQHGRTRVEQQAHALARKDLAAFRKAAGRLLRLRTRAGFGRTHLRE